MRGGSGALPPKPPPGWPLAQASGARRVGVAAARHTKACLPGPRRDRGRRRTKASRPGPRRDVGGAVRKIEVCNVVRPTQNNTRCMR